jgi:hypothetical protein
MRAFVQGVRQLVVDNQLLLLLTSDIDEEYQRRYNNPHLLGNNVLSAYRLVSAEKVIDMDCVIELSSTYLVGYPLMVFNSFCEFLGVHGSGVGFLVDSSYKFFYYNMIHMNYDTQISDRLTIDKVFNDFDLSVCKNGYIVDKYGTGSFFFSSLFNYDLCYGASPLVMALETGLSLFDQIDLLTSTQTIPNIDEITYQCPFTSHIDFYIVTYLGAIRVISEFLEQVRERTDKYSRRGFCSSLALNLNKPTSFEQAVEGGLTIRLNIVDQSVEFTLRHVYTDKGAWAHYDRNKDKLYYSMGPVSLQDVPQQTSQYTITNAEYILIRSITESVCRNTKNEANGTALQPFSFSTSLFDYGSLSFYPPFEYLYEDVVSGPTIRLGIVDDTVIMLVHHLSDDERLSDHFIRMKKILNYSMCPISFELVQPQRTSATCITFAEYILIQMIYKAVCRNTEYELDGKPLHPFTWSVRRPE